MRWGNAPIGRVLKLLLAIVLGTLAAATLAASPAFADDSGDIAALVNRDRSAQGLPGLQRNGALDSVAAAWAAQMAASGTLSHNPQTSSQIPGGWSRWGENVAQGQRSGSEMHTAWMNSPGHRANILNGSFREIGIGIANGAPVSLGAATAGATYATDFGYRG
jgi:uncharacterized protein YkwD